MRQEVEAAGGKRDRDVARRQDVQPTEDGLGFWRTERDMYTPQWPKTSTGAPSLRWVGERRGPTAAEIWKADYAPGGLRPEVGDRRWEPAAGDHLHYAGRWAHRQDYRMHPCGEWVASGPHAEHDGHEVPGYIEAMHEDAVKEDARRDAEAMAQQMRTSAADGDRRRGARRARRPAA